jgi:hypothetical protein
VVIPQMSSASAYLPPWRPSRWLFTLGGKQLSGDDVDHVLIVGAGTADSLRLVITSCEAFENYPPGLPGKNLRLLCPAAYARSPQPFDSVRCADCR